MSETRSDFSAATPARSHRWWLWLGVGLIVAGTRLALISTQASDQPFSDQWGAEGHIVFAQWLHGRMESWNLLATHAEHRPILTRVLTLGLFAANGQWDCRLEMVAGVAVIALGAVGLVLAARRSLAGWWLVGFGLWVVLCFSLPSNYENTLWGFQSQFYFLILLGPLHVAGTVWSRRLDGLWWTAQFAGLLALFSIAAGVASSAAVALFAGIELLRGRRAPWVWGTLLVGGALCAWAWWLQPEAAALKPLHASTVGGLLTSAGYLFAWPVRALHGLLLALPAWGLSFWWLIGRQKDERLAPLVALTLWFGLIVGIIAYGRGSTPGAIAVRYFDVLVIGLSLNAWALLVALQRGLWRRACWVGAGVWLLVAVVALGRINTPRELHGVFEARAQFYSRQTAAIRNYLASGDEAWLERDSLVRHFFPHYQFTKDVLNDPLLRRRLSPSLLLPVEVARDGARSSGKSHASGFEITVGEGGAGDSLYVSEPLDRVGLTYLRLRVRGPMPVERASVWLEAADGRRIDTISDRPQAGAGWHVLNYRAGTESVRLVVRVPSGAQPFTIERPVEVGWLSWVAVKVARSAPWVIAAGLFLLIGGAVTTERARDRLAPAQ